MKAQELMINNLVKFYDEKYSVVSVFDSGQVEIIRFAIVCIVNLDDVHPIPLTEEWYNKLNLKSYTIMWLDSESPIDIEFSFVCDQDTMGKPEVWVYYNGTFLVAVRYLHQLQNLYFCLTEKELSV